MDNDYGNLLFYKLCIFRVIKTSGKANTYVHSDSDSV